TAAATSKPWAVSSRTRPSRRRAWSSARTTRIGVPSLARHFQHHPGRPADRAVDDQPAVEGRQPPPDAGQPLAAAEVGAAGAVVMDFSNNTAFGDDAVLAPEDVDPGARRTT